MSRENQKCCSIYNTQPLQDIDIWKNFKIHVKVSYNFRNCLKDFFDLVDVHIPQELLIRLKIRQAKFFLSNGIKAIKIKITKNNLFWKGNFFFENFTNTLQKIKECRSNKDAQNTFEDILIEKGYNRSRRTPSNNYHSLENKFIFS